MKEGEDVEVEVGPGKSSLIRMVTTKSDFAREEGTRIVTDQNTDLDRGEDGRNPQEPRRSDRPCRELSWD